MVEADAGLPPFAVMAAAARGPQLALVRIVPGVAGIAVRRQLEILGRAGVAGFAAGLGMLAGQREAARSAKNYFALPWGPEGEGAGVELGGKCFRRYETAWESFRDFSLYLHTRDWMPDAKQRNEQDWRAWAAFLAEQQVSDVRHFEREWKGVIEGYRLYELDEKIGQ